MPKPSRRRQPLRATAGSRNGRSHTPARTSLREFQQAIASTLFRPLTNDEAMQPAGAAVAERLVKPNDRLTAFERLQIYNQQYWWRLLGAFAEDFRGLRAVLGERKFDRLATAYLEACGSHSWNLRNIGAQVVSFLESNPALTHPRGDLALDVARVEWARVLAFDDPDKPVLTAKQIAKTPTDRLRLGLQPYISLLELHHPVDELMRTLKRTEIAAVSNAVAATHTRQRKTVTVRRSRAPIHLAVHRFHFSVYYKRLEPEAYHLLLALRGGATLEEACSTAFSASKELPQQSAARIQEWFTRWMEFGWFCRPQAAPK